MSQYHITQAFVGDANFYPTKISPFPLSFLITSLANIHTTKSFSKNLLILVHGQIDRRMLLGQPDFAIQESMCIGPADYSESDDS